MSWFTPERRGTLAALTVAVAIAVLLVVLQPGPRRVRERTEATSSPTGSTTTTVAPAVQLCNLAKQFARDAGGLDRFGVARSAEVFYSESAKLVDGAARGEFDAAARYYTEFNEIGSSYDYDVYRITAAGKGDRWAQLVYRPPLGIETARAAVQFACRVELPSPPTLTTLTTLPEDDPLTGLLDAARSASGARGASGATGGSGATAASGAGGATSTTRR